MRIILINGFKRSGKDFTAKLLKKKLQEDGYKVEIGSMADPLKDFVCRQLELSREQLDYLKNEETQLISANSEIPVTNYRRILQFTGDAIKELYGTPEVFGRILGDKISKSKADIWIIPDFRYQVELAGLGFTVARELITTMCVEGNRAQVPDRSHASEWDLIDNGFEFDWIIRNNTADTYEDISQQLDQFIIAKI